MKQLKEKINSITVVLSSLLLAIMMLILIANVVLRYIPGIGGFKWYMEGAQYLNVWAMLIVGITLTVNDSHLNVNIIELFLKDDKLKYLHIIKDSLTFLFYIGLAYGSFLLTVKSKQDISTMAPLKMSYVYFMIPLTAGLSACSSALHLMIQLRLIKRGREKA